MISLKLHRHSSEPPVSPLVLRKKQWSFSHHGRQWKTFCDSENNEIKEKNLVLCRLSVLTVRSKKNYFKNVGTTFLSPREWFHRKTSPPANHNVHNHHFTKNKNYFKMNFKQIRMIIVRNIIWILMQWFFHLVKRLCVGLEKQRKMSYKTKQNPNPFCCGPKHQQFPISHKSLCLVGNSGDYTATERSPMVVVELVLVVALVVVVLLVVEVLVNEQAVVAALRRRDNYTAAALANLPGDNCSNVDNWVGRTGTAAAPHLPARQFNWYCLLTFSHYWIVSENENKSRFFLIFEFLETWKAKKYFFLECLVF